MEITSLPTDSIYKFSTLAGLVIMISSFLYFTDQRQQAEVDHVNLESDSQIDSLKQANVFHKHKEFVAEMNASNKEVIKLLKQADGLYAKAVAIPNGPKRRKPLLDYIAKVRQVSKTSDELTPKDYKQKGSDLIDLATASMIEHEEFERKEKLLSLNADRARFYIRYLIIFQIIGFVLFTWGVTNWWKMQKLMDQVLLKEAKN